MDSELSDFDLKILDQLQKDCSISSVDLAEKVGLSQSPCWRRLQRLREEGYIKKQVAILDRSKFAPIPYIFAYLKMDVLTDEKRAEFIRKIDAIPEIMECHTVFGEMDIMIKVMVYSMDWYQSFIFNSLMKLPGVKGVQSTVTLGELKSTTAIPVRGMRTPRA
ncbi:MAG: Lrp/AsnC family transcriptional regulator [Alphaproteobacteria bacterium]|nr:MAG: Lrp/AsnC family transcriptional regulator [Alphaproteobacteria bacterium]